LESDCECMNSEGFAIDDSRAGPEVPWERPQIQPLIQFPGIARDHARTVCTNVFRKALLCGVADIETAEIYSYGQRNALLQSAGDGLHETLHGLRQKMGWMVSEEGTTGASYAFRKRIRQKSGLSPGHWHVITPTPQGYWRTGYTIVLRVYRPLHWPQRKSAQFREFYSQVPSLKWYPLGSRVNVEVEVSHEAV
jgi:hypothetical protein